MTNYRPAGQPGRHLPAMEHTCGHDGGIVDAEICGKPATHHLYAGNTETGPADWCMTACDEHQLQARILAFDWHPIAPTCDIPGSMWLHTGQPGAGHCYWPAADTAHAEQTQAQGSTP